MPKIAERCGEVKTPSGIANSFNDDLVVRAADVCRKDRRRVDPLLRETPLYAGHIDPTARATANGAIVMPPVQAFDALPTDGGQPRVLPKYSSWVATQTT
jgi:3-polyprenyl-4-hydroxybenzoate decarboxylase